MGKFSLMDYMNEESKKMQNAADTTDFVSVYDIEPNEQNFYGMRKIQLLKESILLMDGVQENLILVKQPDGSRQPFDQFIIAKTPAARWGDPEDLAGPAVFLASDASDFVNGHVLYVDGGILAYIGKQP